MMNNDKYCMTVLSLLKARLVKVEMLVRFVGRYWFVGLWNGGVRRSAFFFDDGVETIVVRGILYDPFGAIRLDQTVVAFHVLAIAGFGLALDVVSGRVIDGVLEVIWNRGVGGFGNIRFWY